MCSSTTSLRRPHFHARLPIPSPRACILRSVNPTTFLFPSGANHGTQEIRRESSMHVAQSPSRPRTRSTSVQCSLHENVRLQGTFFRSPHILRFTHTLFVRSARKNPRTKNERPLMLHSDSKFFEMHFSPFIYFAVFYAGKSTANFDWIGDGQASCSVPLIHSTGNIFDAALDDVVGAPSQIYCDAFPTEMADAGVYQVVITPDHPYFYRTAV
ncbi:hypothetical protein SCHPADRAFT_67861 [Schizopora paradoxa]|uniref:Uncharacterized protein n=1 Tax=Schizopora paradoxa TaxID=27342 RepID=A0A0H2S6J7_9AGAM|nr:hypothetical protein SCHPADRAFT_67861 [Schizopora paradoxa]